MPLSQQDLTLARALIAWGMVDQRTLQDCAADVARVAAQGRELTLGQVLVFRGFLRPETYQTIVARLRQQYLESSHIPQQVRQATEQIPHMSSSGRYTQTFQAPDYVDESTVDRAVAGWQHQAKQVASGEISLDFEPAVVGGRPAAAAPKREGPDAVIRKALEIPAEHERFPIGGWMVEEYLDAGAWGVVYRVSRIGGDGTPFALKILKQLKPSEQIRTRFIQEARTMAKLSHSGIVHVHDAGTTQGLVWFVMDFLAGPNLKTVIEERGALGVRESLRLMRRLCGAVSYAHESKILHRDLKPDNVVLVDDGKRPVLTDFGLAKDHQAGLNLTVEGQRIGTPLYMAPELLLEASQATVASEIYSLGAILYECLTGKVPFKAKSVYDLLELIEAGQLVPVRKLCKGAPKQLEKLCARILHKKPEKRPQTVVELATELSRIPTR